MAVVLAIQRSWRWWAAVAVCGLVLGCGPGARPIVRGAPAPSSRGQVASSAEMELPVLPEPDAAAAEVKFGYRVEVVMKNLTCPTSLEFDDQGNMYVAEGGYRRNGYGLPNRILRITPSLRVQELTAPVVFATPITDLLWHQGRLYIAHRGAISAIEGDQVRELISDLPSHGDHPNNQMCIGPDGKLYFGQGTASNAGVVGEDNFALGWLQQEPELHDVPAQDIKLTGQTFASNNPLAPAAARARTAPFHAFNQPGTNNTAVSGQTKANGAVLRVNPDGTGLEVFAWGLRNPAGIACSADGTMYTTENGFEPRGSRPVANDRDDLYVLKEGGWYGWPDFASGLPLTDPQFQVPGAEPLRFLMAEHPPVEQPLLRFPANTCAAKILATRNSAFVRRGLLIVALTSPLPTIEGLAENPLNNRVLLIDPETGATETLFGKKMPDELTHLLAEIQGLSAGPRRPVDVVFCPAGNELFVVDYGSIVMTEQGPRPVPNTGVIWRIRPAGKLAAAPGGRGPGTGRG